MQFDNVIMIGYVIRARLQRARHETMKVFMIEEFSNSTWVERAPA